MRRENRAERLRDGSPEQQAHGVPQMPRGQGGRGVLHRDAGVHQIVIGTIPRDPKTVQSEVERLAEKIVAPASKL